MIKILESGYDLVSGWKIRRLDPWHKTMPSKLFNLTVSIVCGKRLHDFNCGIKAYRSSVVRFIQLYGDYHRFIPVMAKWQGFRITEMPVAHRARVHGVSKYGVSRLVSGFLDLVSLMFMRSFSSKPLHFFGLIGLILMLFGLGTCGYFGYEWIQTGGHACASAPVGGRLLARDERAVLLAWPSGRNDEWQQKTELSCG